MKRRDPLALLLARARGSTWQGRPMAPRTQIAYPIRTARLLLRPFREDDRPAFAALNADPEVRAFFPGLLSREASDDFANRIDAHFAEHGYGFFAIEPHGPGATEAPFLGFCGLSIPNFDAPFMPAVEIGWRLARSAWGHGYATEAARACLTLAWTTLGLDEVVSFTVPENLRSRAVMKRIGMRHEPERDFDHPNLPIGHALRRHVFYCISKP